MPTLCILVHLLLVVEGQDGPGGERGRQCINQGTRTIMMGLSEAGIVLLNEPYNNGLVVPMYACQVRLVRSWQLRVKSLPRRLHGRHSGSSRQSCVLPAEATHVWFRQTVSQTETGGVR